LCWGCLLLISGVALDEDTSLSQAPHIDAQGE
jgi:hypothetical protein